MGGIKVPFNVPPLTGRELEYLAAVLAERSFSGNGRFTGLCHAWLKERLGVPEALLTHSCTAALEMAAILARLGPGDEVIMPSFTFVSTANAVALRGAVPVFVDIRTDTLNLDEALIEQAITPRTKAIFVVHYAGVCAEMDPVRAIANRHDLLVVEDAAQALLSTYKGRLAGQLGDLACFSFHETKNVSSGEGGALAVASKNLAERAFVVWEKGTNRRSFKLGLVDRYTWVDLGSSFLPSEFTAAVLFAQLEHAESLNAARLRVWARYHDAFADLETAGKARRPIVPEHCGHNGHLYYLLVEDGRSRDRLIQALGEKGIMAPFHYVPLHTAAAGLVHARAAGDLPITQGTSERLLRLPLYASIEPDAVDAVIDEIHRLF